jgi:biotin transport system substrate-specific component
MNSISQAATKNIRDILHIEINLPLSLLKALGVGVFVALTALGSFVRVPLFFTPVPLTLQTFFVLLSGAVLGKKYGFFTQLLYVSLGIIGIPLFAGAGFGLAVILGPTGGYLMSFVFIAFMLGFVLQSFKSNYLQLIFIFVSASMFILICGCLWLTIFLGYSLKSAFILGFVPFVVGDVIKSILAATVYNGIKHKF